MKSRIPLVMNKQQRKDFNREIAQAVNELNEQYSESLDATILYVLHKVFGFGIGRLKKFYEAFFQLRKELSEYYLMDSEDLPWLCSRNLEEIGVDLKAWEKEMYAKYNIEEVKPSGK